MKPWTIGEAIITTPRELVAYYGARLADVPALRYEALLHRQKADTIEAEWVQSIEGKNAEARAAALATALRNDSQWLEANTARHLAELRAGLADAHAKEAFQALELVKLEIQYANNKGER